MSCKRNINLPLYVGGDLARLKSIFVRWHIRRCETCSSELNILENSKKVINWSLDKKKISVQANELWREIRNQLPDSETTETIVVKRIKWKENFIKKPAYIVVGSALILFVVLFGLRMKESEQSQKLAEAQENTFQNYPVVEKVNNPNVTVLTYLTDDPKIKIVWFFED
jgi:hypothetical protein